MALTVETGTGSATANSYISQADADSYIASHGAESAWSALSSDDKDKYLRLACQYLDLRYANKFKGYKATKEQALCWPRTWVVDNNGFAYESNEIPTCLKQAQVEAALRLLAGDDLLGVIDSGTIKSESSALGPMSESIEYMGGKPIQKRYPKIESLLWQIINDSQSQISRG
jgi:hypothetical protein